MRKHFIHAMLALLAVALIPAAAAAAKVTLKLGHTGAPNHHYHLTSEKFAEAVKQKSNGDIEIKIFPSDQLGTQRQLIEGTQLGTVDMVLTSDSALSAFVDSFGVLNLPFLFDGIDHVAKAMDGKAGELFTEDSAKKQMVILGYWENGFRHISNSKRPINKPSDLNGLKLRTPNAFVTIESFKAMGAMPTPMGFGEIYSALQLGTVDGQENPVAHILTQKWYEVQKFFSLTGHQHNVEPLVMSKTIFDALSPAHQKILKDEARAHAAVSRKMVMDDEGKQLEELSKLITVNKVADMNPFRELCKPVYAKFAEKYAKYIDAVQAAK
ncbi:MAG: TRAP transporter substrate-binding protein [Deltaproteobacteria bacterium]|jgi:tripartite ATP-independent transporter DctP family solute receptor|nr:TRAP transporter substrate-binding protein [Deltaproteobacteria bacterium]